jgi:hypothetical protein
MLAHNKADRLKWIDELEFTGLGVRVGNGGDSDAADGSPVTPVLMRRDGMTIDGC